VQEQRRVRDQQKEQDVVQGVQVAQVSGGGHVEEWVPVRPAVQLVQDTLLAPGTATAAPPPPQQQPAPTATPAPAAATTASATTTPAVRGSAFSAAAAVGSWLQNFARPGPHAAASAAVDRRQTPSALGRR